MDKLQAIRIIKSALKTLKKGVQAESIEEKQSVLAMFDAFSGQIEQALETLEKVEQEPYHEEKPHSLLDAYFRMRKESE